MIPKSVCYKLVRKSDKIIIAEGSAKDMRSLCKKTPNTFVGLGSFLPSIGKRWGA